MPSKPKESVSSLARAFEVLELFSLQTPILSVDDMTQALGYTRSMTYRYVKELCDAGFLASASSGAYGLGPRIIELERLLALTDPLYLAGRDVLPTLACGNSAFLLHNLYGEKVLCIYKEGPDTVEHAGEKISIKRARGLPFPLFQGAASLALLAFMPPHRMRQTYLKNAAEIARSGLGEDWAAFRRTLTAIRRQGYATSHEQVAPSLGGVAVPVLLPHDQRLVGSIAHTYHVASMNAAMEAESARELRAISEQLAARYLQHLTPQ
jgi:DNA-binding IclR family transcriptional regulator